MSERGKSILFLIVGLIAVSFGIYGLVFDEYRKFSVWHDAWNVVRIIAGIAAIIVSVKGTIQK